MELSKRLQTVAAAVTPGHRIADVGTDHGYVPIYLVKNGLCPSACAMDVNKGPLARAEEHIGQEGLSDKIATRLSDGLAGLSPDETDTVVIAGMGGELICRILKNAPEFLKAGMEFILQPQSEWFKVRHLLHDAGYHIAGEWFLKEDGKYYVVIKALPAPAGQRESYTDEFHYAYGACLLREQNPVLLEYLQKEQQKKKSILARMAQPEEEAKGNIPAHITETEQQSRNSQENPENTSGKSRKDPEQNAMKRLQRQKQLEEEIRAIGQYLRETV